MPGASSGGAVVARLRVAILHVHVRRSTGQPARVPKERSTIPNVSFVDFDSSAIARALCVVSEDPDDVVEAFFERREVVEVPSSHDEHGVLCRREQGLSLRLVRGRHTWLAARDEITAGAFMSALRAVERRRSESLVPRLPVVTVGCWPAPGMEARFASFPRRVEGRLRALRLGFPFRMWIRHHRRWIRVVGRELAPEVEEESFFSCRVRSEWGQWGTLLPRLDDQAVEQVAESLAAAFRCRSASPPAMGRGAVLLGPSAAATFLHEAVAHALEVDTLAQSGDPEAAIGVALGSETLDILDDPMSGPFGLRRATDDEGAPVLRRWLLRQGVVEQPLADRRWARGSGGLSSGAARRQSRHVGPVPRSLHLELLPGSDSIDDLARKAGSGLFAPEASRGRLDPVSGEFSLRIPHGRRLMRGAVGDRVGSFVVRGTVGDLLGRIGGIGDRPVLSGAGWCAKGGQKMPVWSTTPALLLDQVEVTP